MLYNLSDALELDGLTEGMVHQINVGTKNKK